MASKEPIAFPAYHDAYTGATAIGLTGVYRGVRMTLHERVVSGSWRRADGTRTFRYSRWVTFWRRVESVLMEDRALVPETCYMVVAIVRWEAAA